MCFAIMFIAPVWRGPSAPTWTHPLLRDGGKLIAMKGKQAAEELKAAQEVLDALGWGQAPEAVWCVYAFFSPRASLSFLSLFTVVVSPFYLTQFSCVTNYREEDILVRFCSPIGSKTNNFRQL